MLQTLTFRWATTILIAALPIITYSQKVSRDSVQAVLRILAEEHPEKVSYIHETSRWHLKNPRPEAVSEEFLLKLQDAFYYDIEASCRLYGWQYLVSWRVLASKAARESFWGTSYLCNRANNYFGIRSKNKEWICENFEFCESIERNDPLPSDFAIFEDFESSLWMFIHTIYSPHFLERLPDEGERIIEAIDYERKKGHPYWQIAEDGEMLSSRVPGKKYSEEEIIFTWSEHPKNNLCVECSRESDINWVGKVVRAANRAKY
jgi:hypothetical protein